MKRIGLFFTFFLTLAIGTSHAKSISSPEIITISHKVISSETVLRVLKLTSMEVNYSYEILVEMYSVNQVAISEMSDPDVYLVSIQQADGGTVEVIIFDSF